MRRDLEHLNLLAIFHYVVAGLSALMVIAPLIYVVIGILMVNAAPPPKKGGPDPAVIGWVAIAFGVSFTLILVAYAALTALTGYFLHRRKARTFCFVMSALQCTQVPQGTLLGVFTILVLVRPSVQDLFAGRISEDGDPEDDDRRPRLDYREERDERFEEHREGYYEPRQEEQERRREAHED